jgi:hypothetical protein
MSTLPNPRYEMPVDLLHYINQLVCDLQINRYIGRGQVALETRTLHDIGGTDVRILLRGKVHAFVWMQGCGVQTLKRMVYEALGVARKIEFIEGADTNFFRDED